MQILVVDDALMTRKIITKILIEAGHESITAANGDEALKLIDEFASIEVILSDWNMPEMNGIELLKEIRKREDFQTIPFYLISAKANKGDLAEADQYGVTGFIAKPFTPADIMEILKKHIIE